MKSLFPCIWGAFTRQWRLIPLLTLSLCGAFAPCSFAAQAQDGIEITRNSKLVKVELPEGAMRSTSAPDIAKFAELLQSMAKVNNGKISQTEVFIWEKAAKPRGKFAASLGRAKYKYNAKPTSKWEDLGSVTPFGLDSPNESSQHLGLWLEQDDFTLLAWGRFQFDAAEPPKPSTEKAGPDLSQLADKLAKATAQPASQPATPANVHRANDAHDVMRGVALPKLPAFTKLTAKPGTVRGQVKDEAGKPIVGAQIITHSSYAGGFRSSNRAKTNAQGIYEVALSTGIAQVVNADCVVRYNGKRYVLPLEPVDGERDEFNSTDGHIENFVLRTFGIADPAAENHPEWGTAYYGGHLRLVRFGDVPTGGSIQVMLTPQGPLLDGTTGRTLDIRIPNKGEGEMFVNNIPLGRYEMKVQILDGKTQPLRVQKVFSQDELTDTLTVDFQPNDGDLASLGRSGVQRLDVLLKP